MVGDGGIGGTATRGGVGGATWAAAPGASTAIVKRATSKRCDGAAMARSLPTRPHRRPVREGPQSRACCMKATADALLSHQQSTSGAVLGSTKKAQSATHSLGACHLR